MGKKRKKSVSRVAEIPVPALFLERMRERLGEDGVRAFAAALAEPPSVAIRLNRRKVADPEAFMRRFAGYGVSPVEWCPSGYRLERRPQFVHDPLLHAGLYYVQEAASMVYESIVAHLMSQPGLRDGDRRLRVLDLCAAPGGKSTAILNGLSGKYILVANEFDHARSRILKENLDKWGDPNVIVTNSPTGKFGGLKEFFAIVAVDAPCSGEGMMRRESVARSQWNPGLVEQCVALQRDILADAVAALRPGGFLIYSTCTFNEEENERNVEWLGERYGLSVVGSPRRFMPHEVGCEGLFVALLQKPGSPDIVPAESALRKAGLNILGEGTEKTTMKGSVEIPSSRQVLAHDYDRSAFPLVNLDLDGALAYLRRNALTLPPDTPQGYVTVAYEGYPLGLVKNLGTRANNLYPSEWRVMI